MHRRLVLERVLTPETMNSMARHVISAAAASGTRVLIAATALEPSTPSGNNNNDKSRLLIIILAYIVTFVVILAVLERLYSHMFHFTPPYLRAYHELVAAQGLVQRGAFELNDGTQLGPHLASFRMGPPTPPSPGGGVMGFVRPSSAGTSEIEEVVEEPVLLSSEVLARLERDLRSTSFREREMLAAALGSDLPAGRSFFFPIRSHSSRTVLPPDFDLSLNNLNRASQSARFGRAPSSAALAINNDPRNQDGFFFPIRSNSSRNMLPPDFDPNSNVASQSGRFNQGGSDQSLPSTSDSGAGRPSSSYRWTGS